MRRARNAAEAEMRLTGAETRENAGRDESRAPAETKHVSKERRKRRKAREKIRAMTA